MIETEFKTFSRRIGMTFFEIASDRCERGVVQPESSSRQPKDGCLLTIKKSGLPTETETGTFAFKNDPAREMVRIELGDTRVNAGQSYEVNVVPASEITPDAIRARIIKFVDDWLAGPSLAAPNPPVVPPAVQCTWCANTLVGPCDQQSDGHLRQSFFRSALYGDMSSASAQAPTECRASQYPTDPVSGNQSLGWPVMIFGLSRWRPLRQHRRARDDNKRQA